MRGKVEMTGGNREGREKGAVQEGTVLKGKGDKTRKARRQGGKGR